MWIDIIISVTVVLLAVTSHALCVISLFLLYYFIIMKMALWKLLGYCGHLIWTSSLVLSDTFGIGVVPFWYVVSLVSCTICSLDVRIILINKSDKWLQSANFFLSFDRCWRSSTETKKGRAAGVWASRKCWKSSEMSCEAVWILSIKMVSTLASSFFQLLVIVTSVHFVYRVVEVIGWMCFMVPISFNANGLYSCTAFKMLLSGSDSPFSSRLG